MLILNHRATISRHTWTDDDGAPFQRWTTIATGIPCLFTLKARDDSATTSAVQQTEDWASGILYTNATADIKPSDRITLTRPLGISLVVSTSAATVLDFDGVSHKEFRVKTV